MKKRTIGLHAHTTSYDGFPGHTAKVFTLVREDGTTCSLTEEDFSRMRDKYEALGLIFASQTSNGGGRSVYAGESPRDAYLEYQLALVKVKAAKELLGKKIVGEIRVRCGRYNHIIDKYDGGEFALAVTSTGQVMSVKHPEVQRGSCYLHNVENGIPEWEARPTVHFVDVPAVPGEAILSIPAVRKKIAEIAAPDFE